jgi:hypothetical protein
MTPQQLVASSWDKSPGGNVMFLVHRLSKAERGGSKNSGSYRLILAPFM